MTGYEAIENMLEACGKQQATAAAAFVALRRFNAEAMAAANLPIDTADKLQEIDRARDRLAWALEAILELDFKPINFDTAGGAPETTPAGGQQ